MAESIKKSDIIENDILKSVIIEFEQAQVKIKAFNDELRQTAKLSKEGLNNVKLNSVTDINQAKIAILEANNAIKQKVLLEKGEIEVATALQQAKVKQAKAENDLAKQKAQSDALTQKQTRSEQMLQSAYSRVNGWLGKLRNEYRDLAIKKELNGKLTDAEITRMQNIESRMVAYDNALKKVDASMGNHQRNVGNYAMAYNGLGNSVNQLTREMPAFANSVGTGFMAISNNLPIFFDEISKIKQANKELIAQGQPVKSVFSQIGASIFSIGTLLSVGVTLLTVYGAKIVEWVSNLGGANTQLERQREIENKLNEERKKARDYVSKESSEYVGYLEALRQTNKGSKERSELITEINDKFGTTLKNISDETAFQNQLNKSIERYIEFKKNEYLLKVNDEKIQIALDKRLKAEEKLSEIYRQGSKLGLSKEEINNLINSSEGIGSSINLVTGGVYDFRSEVKKAVDEIARMDAHLKHYGYVFNETSNLIDGSGFNNTSTKTKTVKEKEDEEYKNRKLKGAKLINDELQKYDWEQLNKHLEDVLTTYKDETLMKIEHEGELRELKILQGKHTNEEMAKLEKENQLAILQDKIDFLKRMHEDTTKLEIEYQKLLNSEVKKTQSTFAKDFNTVVKFSADYFIDQSNRKIAQIEKEQQQHEKAYSLYSDLAKNGNIQAKESLALENQQIVEANKKKQAELKKQAMWKLLEGGVNAYAKNAGDSSVKNPVMKTFSDITLLTQLLKTLPSFEVGTEDTGKNGNGIDGRGGFHAILHPNERVLTKEQNKLIGNVSNEDLALTMNKINSGELVKLKEGATSSVGNWQNIALISEIQDLKNIIKNKPDFKIEAGEIIQGAMSIVETKTTKNSIYSNRYIVK
jgi:hypothetical protein